MTFKPSGGQLNVIVSLPTNKIKWIFFPYCLNVMPCHTLASNSSVIFRACNDMRYCLTCFYSIFGSDKSPRSQDVCVCVHSCDIFKRGLKKSTASKQASTQTCKQAHKHASKYTSKQEYTSMKASKHTSKQELRC